MGLGIGLVAIALLAVLRTSTWLDSLELRMVDARTRMFADAREPDERIVMMQVLEGDVEDVRRDLGMPWPWQLEINSALVRVLEEAGASVLVVDILHLDRGAGARRRARGRRRQRGGRGEPRGGGP